ncbi:TraD/TraG, TraM recognition site [Comamonadaceae bacterium]
MFNLDAKKIIGHAMSELERLTPIQYKYAMHTRDLRNVTPAGFIFDNQGRRLAGRFSPADITDGMPSPAIWMLFLPMVALSIVGTILLALAAFYGTFIPVTQYGESYSFEVANGGGVFLSVLWAVWSVYKGIVLIHLLASIPLMWVGYLAYVVLAETEPTRAAHHYAWLFGITTLAGIVFVPVLGPIGGAFLCAGAPLTMFYLHIKGLEMARHQALTEAAEEAKGMTALPDAGLREAQRKGQAAAALNDLIPGANKPAPLVILGIDTGWVREETHNPLSGDKGQPFGLSLGADLSKHLFVFGGTGSGKTSGVLRPIAKAWVEWDMGGCLIADAKAGALPIELHAAGLIDYLVYPSDVSALKVNLCASMSPVFFAKAMADVFVQGGDKSSVFDKAAAIYVVAAATLVQFAVSKRIAGVALTFAYLDRFRSDIPERERVLLELNEHHREEIRNDSALMSNFLQWANAYPRLPAETRGSVDFTLDTYFKSLVSNSTISQSLTGDGVDIAEMICRGARVGLVLSESDGEGGVVALALIKAAVFARLKARAQNPKWREQGERDVLFMVDECSSIISDLDGHAASVLRSLGARMVYATQSYSQVVNKMGNHDAANAFLGNFKSCLTLSAEGAGEIGATTGTYAYVSERVGNVYRLDKHDTGIEAVALDKAVNKSRSSGLENRQLGAIGAKLSSVTTMIAEARKMFSLSQQSLGERKDRLRESASDSYQLRLMPAVTANEMTYLCAGTHKMVGVIERGNVGRVVVGDIRPSIAEESDKRTVNFMTERLARPAARARLSA